MQEKDVENAFLNKGFYSQLGYRGAGYDLRSEFTLPDNKRPRFFSQIMYLLQDTFLFYPVHLFG
jgi:hypothetical protein